LQSETDEFPQGSEFARQHGTRAQLSVPLMREGTAIGTISLRRIEAQSAKDPGAAVIGDDAVPAAACPRDGLRLACRRSLAVGGKEG
jgi:hypothetical protein